MSCRKDVVQNEAHSPKSSAVSRGAFHRHLSRAQIFLMLGVCRITCHKVLARFASHWVRSQFEDIVSKPGFALSLGTCMLVGHGIKRKPRKERFLTQPRTLERESCDGVLWNLVSLDVLADGEVYFAVS